MLAGIEHRMMLDCGSNYMIPGTDQTENRKIVSFGTSAREDHLGGAASQQRGHGLASALDGGPRLLSMMMDGRRVSKVLRVVRTHGVQHRKQHWCGGIIVEVNPPHTSILRVLAQLF